MKRFAAFLGSLGFLACCAILGVYVLTFGIAFAAVEETPGVGYVTAVLSLIGVLAWKWDGSDIETYIEGKTGRALSVFLIGATTLFVLGVSRGLFGSLGKSIRHMF